MLQPFHVAAQSNQRATAPMPNSWLKGPRWEKENPAQGELDGVGLVGWERGESPKMRERSEPIKQWVRPSLPSPQLV